MQGLPWANFLSCLCLGENRVAFSLEKPLTVGVVLLISRRPLTWHLSWMQLESILYGGSLSLCYCLLGERLHSGSVQAMLFDHCTNTLAFRVTIANLLHNLS